MGGRRVALRKRGRGGKNFEFLCVDASGTQPMQVKIRKGRRILESEGRSFSEKKQALRTSSGVKNALGGRSEEKEVSLRGGHETREGFFIS